MTRNTRFSLILPALATLSLLTGLGSCSKSSSSNSSSAVSATVSGKGFASTQNIALDITTQSTLGFFGYYVANGDSIAISLAVPDNTPTGTINWTSNDNVDLEYFDSKGTIDFESFVPKSHGTFVLSTYDKTNKKIAGTFSGVLYGYINPSDSVVITDGKFNLAYITE